MLDDERHEGWDCVGTETGMAYVEVTRLRACRDW